jgi:hypothetical protein
LFTPGGRFFCGQYAMQSNGVSDMKCEQKACACNQRESITQEPDKRTNRRLFKIASLMKGLPAKVDNCAKKLEIKGDFWEIITELHKIKHHIEEIKRELSDEPHFLHVFHDDIGKEDVK